MILGGNLLFPQLIDLGFRLAQLFDDIGNEITIVLNDLQLGFGDPLPLGRSEQ